MVRWKVCNEVVHAVLGGQQHRFDWSRRRVRTRLQVVDFCRGFKLVNKVCEQALS